MMKVKNKVLIVLFCVILIILWIKTLIVTKPFLVNYTPFGEYETKLGVFVFGCIVTPLWEELIYRHVPFQITKKINNFTKEDFTWITLVLSSFWFGIGHNNGIYNILMQGLSGAAIACVYLINKYSYWSAVTVHALWNAYALYILPTFN